MIRDFNFEWGRLVLIHNTAIEKSLNRKMRPRYLGPVVVVSCNYKGAYIVAELDGSIFDRPIVAFQLVPYLAQTDPLQVPLHTLDVGPEHIHELEDSVDHDETLDDDPALSDE